MQNKLMDLHNHTTFSDGRHTPEKIIENAIEKGISAIGISDHYNTYKCNSISEVKLTTYINKINNLKEKYADKITVLCGIEICMNRSWGKLEELPYDKLNKLDYVLLEYIDAFSDSVPLSEIGEYTKSLNCKVGLAHTNLLELCNRYGLDKTVKMLRDNNLFWELNVNEGYGYFDDMVREINDQKVKDLFSKLKDNEIEITVGSDTHSLFFYSIDRIKLGNKLIQYNPCNKA